MRAIQVREFGGPDMLVAVDLPAPVAGPGQVVVGLAAADVIYLDTLLRRGWGGEFFPRTPPYVPGTGGAGTVLSTGEGVDPAWIGRRVVATLDTGYAEQVVAGLDQIVELPGGLGFQQAAAVLHDGATAIMLARLGRFEKGEWVLVTAAAGGAGSTLVQLARDAGARVVAAALGGRKLALARELGAEHTVDYGEEGWQRRGRDLTGGAGLVYDGAGGALGQAAFEAAADGGRFVTYGTADGGFADIDPREAERRGVSVVNALASGPPDPADMRAWLTEALDLAARGSLRPAIGATFPLERARDAHVSLEERRTVGKSLLLM
ncbi:zinc-binding dehydrogenase [Nonomuraea sp. SBT364]|uniref:zinc-binding dehydrogenase n=1 Tax=Nonomuraea sp. SBT364 TaxID=1580530 RepID=UPI00066EB05D|nr:zinc-binding dehydrogenase [Nonomuraea sp. SBT364]